MSEIVTIGLDIAKNVFQLHAAHLADREQPFHAIVSAHFVGS